MSKNRTKYSTKLKTKLVLEVLTGDRTLTEIASANKIIPKNLYNWQAIFLANAELAMEVNKVSKAYKYQIIGLQAKNDEYARVVGKLTVEKEWLAKKLVSLDLSKK